MAVLTNGNAAIKSSHWYTAEGESMHEVKSASGEGNRPTTLRDAKKLGLLPSVTTILSILEKPALQDWKLDQVIKACMANPIGPEESNEYYFDRIKDSAFQQVVDAADLGSEVHRALEEAFDGKPMTEKIARYTLPVLDWFREKKLTVVTREQRVVSCREGYAGTTDLTFTFGADGIGILDYKTKKTKPGVDVKAYDEHRMQLAAYAACIYGVARLKNVVSANVFISTTEPGRFEVIKHGDLTPYYDAFLSLCGVWRCLKNYDPRKGV